MPVRLPQGRQRAANASRLYPSEFLIEIIHADLIFLILCKQDALDILAVIGGGLDMTVCLAAPFGLFVVRNDRADALHCLRIELFLPVRIGGKGEQLRAVRLRRSAAKRLLPELPGIVGCAFQIRCDLIPFNICKKCFQAFGLGRFVPFVFIGITGNPLVFQKEALHRGTAAKVFRKLRLDTALG